VKIFVVAILLSATAGAASKHGVLHPISVCAVSQHPGAFVGKRLTLDGYVNDLGSHGFVLAAKRGCKGRGLVELRDDAVLDNPTWRRVFLRGTVGPRHATLTGVVYWGRNRGGALIPALRIERIERLAEHDADLRDF
jgi:hypothetical protein